jgi:hypothetical protein
MHDENPDEEIRPYIDFIEKHALAKCDFESCDSDQFDAFFPTHDFEFSLRHQYEWVILYAGIHLLKPQRFESLIDLDKIIKTFNHKHATKLSYYHDLEKRWFYSRPIYKLYFYHLTLEAPLSKEPKEINSIFVRFYEDILSFFMNEKIDAPRPQPRSVDTKVRSFTISLEKQIEYLKKIKKYKL